MNREKYKTAAGFRMALESRLHNLALKERIDLQRLRTSVAFDRFLARVCHVDQDRWALKGGYALDLQMQSARATKDLDLTLPAGVGERDNPADSAAIRSLLQEAASVPLGDHFEFRIGEPIQDIEAAPYGGARFLVNARMAGRTFADFHVVGARII